jgi:hypothetical protein
MGGECRSNKSAAGNGSEWQKRESQKRESAMIFQAQPDVPTFGDMVAIRCFPSSRLLFSNTEKLGKAPTSAWNWGLETICGRNRDGKLVFAPYSNYALDVLELRFLEI